MSAAWSKKKKTKNKTNVHESSQLVRTSVKHLLLENAPHVYVLSLSSSSACSRRGLGEPRTPPLKSCQPCSYLVHYCIAGSLSRRPPASSSRPRPPSCRSPWPCPLRTAPSVGLLLDSSISLPASLYRCSAGRRPAPSSDPCLCSRRPRPPEPNCPVPALSYVARSPSSSCLSHLPSCRLLPHLLPRW